MSHKLTPRRGRNMRKQIIPREGHAAAGAYVPELKRKEARIDEHACIKGHNPNGSVSAFMRQYRTHLVKMRNWGGKSFTFA